MSGSTRWVVVLSMLVLLAMSVVGVEQLHVRRERPQVESVRTRPTASPLPPPLPTSLPEAPPQVSSPAESHLENVHRALGTLQYVMNDYALAVDLQGRIVNAAECAEQGQLLDQVAALLDACTPGTEPQVHERLRGQLTEVRDLVDARAEPWFVRDAISHLRNALVAALDVRTAPAELPSIARGAGLYAEACAVPKR